VQAGQYAVEGPSGMKAQATPKCSTDSSTQRGQSGASHGTGRSSFIACQPVRLSLPAWDRSQAKDPHLLLLLRGRLPRGVGGRRFCLVSEQAGLVSRPAGQGGRRSSSVGLQGLHRHASP
jgi:hypothetical protein